MSDKKSKRIAPEASRFPEKVWAVLIDLAGDARGEFYKQTGALITLAEGAAAGGFNLAAKVNVRLDELSQDGLAIVERMGAEALTKSRELPEKATQSARDVAQRASQSARVLVTSPGAKAA